MKPKLEKQKMTFFEWLDALTIKRVAALLGVNESAVRHWRRGCVLPKDELKLEIMKLTRGAITPTDLVLMHFKKSNKKRWSR